MLEEYMDDRINRIRQLIQRQDEIAEESARLKAELHELLELDNGPRKARKDMLSPSGKRGLFAGLKKEARTRERFTA